MKSILFTCVLVVFSITLNAQNIVKNGGHEVFKKMPSVVNLTDSCFRELFPVGVVPPILNPINPEGIASANSSPDHHCTQPRSGQAHGGFFFSPKYENPEYELCFPLGQGFKYRVSTYVLLTKNSDLAADLFSFWFTNWGYLSTTGQVNAVPDYRSPLNVYLTDTDNYQKIEFEYTAKGNETALVLGNIVDAGYPKGSNFIKTGGGSGQSIAYYYVDDINVNPIPELEASYTICPGVPANIIPKNYTHCTGKLPVSWFFTNSPQTIISTNDTLDISFSQDANIGAIIGTDTVYTQVTIIKDNYTNPLPDTSYICEGGSKLLNADLGISGLSYLWNDSSTGASLNVTAPGLYSVTISNTTCSYVFETLVLNALNPAWHPQEDSFFICGTDPINLSFTLPAGYKIISSDGQMGTSLSFTQAGAYQLRLSPSCDINDIDSIFIFDNKSLEASVRVPNAFTPNGDGKNDVFKVVFDKEPTEYELNILNRWGKPVYTSFNPKEGWDGRFLDVPAVIDVYVFTLKCSLTACGTTQEVKRMGDLTLVR